MVIRIIRLMNRQDLLTLVGKGSVERQMGKAQAWRRLDNNLSNDFRSGSMRIPFHLSWRSM